MIRHTLLAGALALAGTAQAAAVQYDFGFNPNAAALLNATTTVAHLNASSLTSTGGGQMCQLRFVDPEGWACGESGHGTVSFTVSADAGWQFDVLGFSFEGLGMGSDLPAEFIVTSSLDGFAQPLIQGDLAHQVLFQRYLYDTGLTAQGLRGPLELRISYNGGLFGPTGGAWLLDNLRLDVTVRPDAALPEPGGLSLAALALLAVIRRGRSTAAGRRASARPARG